MVKSEKHYTEAALDEIKLLEKVHNAVIDDPFRQRVVCLHRHFLTNGPHGSHVCMAFEVLGQNLLKFIQFYDYRGIPIPLVKRMTKQILQGLVYLHDQCGIIHTDLKPENVLLEVDETVISALAGLPSPSTELSRSLDEIKLNSESDSTFYSTNPLSIARYAELPQNEINVKIADLGNACWINKHFTRDIQTRQYRSPEVILGADYDTSADIWSLACMVFELITGEFLFHPKDSDRFSKDADHMAQIIELIGRFPRYMMKGDYVHDIFNRKGDIRGILELNIWYLEDVLIEKYRMSKLESKRLSDFLLPMLEIDPVKRISAREALKSPWLLQDDDDEKDIVIE